MIWLLSVEIESFKENTGQILHDKADLAKMALGRNGKPELGKWRQISYGKQVTYLCYYIGMRVLYWDRFQMHATRILDRSFLTSCEAVLLKKCTWKWSRNVWTRNFRQVSAGPCCPSSRMHLQRGWTLLQHSCVLRAGLACIFILFLFLFACAVCSQAGST